MQTEYSNDIAILFTDPHDNKVISLDIFKTSTTKWKKSAENLS